MLPSLHRGNADLLDLRNQAIACMSLVDVRETNQSFDTTAPLLPGSFVVDAQFQRFAIGDQEGNIVIRRLEDGRRLLELPGTGASVWDLRFSPDDHFLFAQYFDHQGKVWDLVRSEALFKGPVSKHAIDFSPDGRFAAAGRPDGSIEVLDLTTRSTFKILRQGAAHSINE